MWLLVGRVAKVEYVGSGEPSRSTVRREVPEGVTKTAE
jgi:hypothetical protein